MLAFIAHLQGSYHLVIIFSLSSSYRKRSTSQTFVLFKAPSFTTIELRRITCEHWRGSPHLRRGKHPSVKAGQQLWRVEGRRVSREQKVRPTIELGLQEGLGQGYCRQLSTYHAEQLWRGWSGARLPASIIRVLNQLRGRAIRAPFLTSPLCSSGGTWR